MLCYNITAKNLLSLVVIEHWLALICAISTDNKQSNLRGSDYRYSLMNKYFIDND